MRMLAEDWETLYVQWSNALFDQHANPIEDITVNSKAQVFSYLFIEYTTNKATFYVTKECKDGFWVPNSAVISDYKNEVRVAHWCKITIIRYR